MLGGLHITIDELLQMAKNNIVAFLVGYMLATGELHLLIADAVSL